MNPQLSADNLRWILALGFMATVGLFFTFSALAQIKWRLIDHRSLETAHFLRDMIGAVVALVFSILFIWCSRNTGHSVRVYWAPFILAGAALALGIPVHRSQRGRVTRPGPVPPFPPEQRAGTSGPDRRRPTPGGHRPAIP